MPSLELPGVPQPVRSAVRPVPVLNPLLLGIGGVVYGLVLGVVVALWWGVDVLVDVPAPPLSLRTAAALWLLGIVLAVVRDTVRKRRMAVAVYPGWVVRSFGANTVTVPVDDITRVRVRASLVDRLVGTKTVDVFDAEGHRLRLPRLAHPDGIERTLADWQGTAVDDPTDALAGADRESQTGGASRDTT